MSAHRQALLDELKTRIKERIKYYMGQDVVFVDNFDDLVEDLFEHDSESILENLSDDDLDEMYGSFWLDDLYEDA